MIDSTDDDLTALPSELRRPRGLDEPRLDAGQIFGPYTIVRLLGRGGMGEVYEAEHREHGRRVAIKVLNQRLAGADDRARFLREGQIAAGLNHPNTVYVYGSEEIAGTPVIAMELVAGGTLKDRVDREGPLAPDQAVDVILQVVAGLAVAQTCGILHRDVKPSNCFVDPDGTVKVGDFGLSIPIAAPEVTQPNEMATFLGTPQYAAPEQLRGQPLDLRADIYAVGATLYYLLTGRPPFDDRDLMTLVTRIATETPALPQRVDVRIPAGVSAILLRCLAKRPEDRPPSYADLDASLQPFGSSTPAPARLGLRVVAGVIDAIILFLAAAPLTLAPVLEFDSAMTVKAHVAQQGAWALQSPVWLTVIVGLLTVAYYGLLERNVGGSLGKRICGLVVTRASGQPAGAARVVLRAAIFMVPAAVALVPKVLAAVTGDASVLASGGLAARALMPVTLVLNVALFSSMRWKNAFVAWHDLLTDTRVVSRPGGEVRVRLGACELWPAREVGLATGQIGPFRVVREIGRTEEGALLLGYDPVLRRDVWLHQLPVGSPEVGAARTSIGRPGRLRWMNGRRSEVEAWDGFEAPDGRPLLNAVAMPQPWSSVKRWLATLARELAAAAQDGTTPALALDRIWITRDNQARLLDFAAPGLPPRGAPAGAYAPVPQRFLAEVAAVALSGRTGSGGDDDAAPVPRQAQAMLDMLARSGFPSLRDAADGAAIVAAGDDRVTKTRRAASVVLGRLPLLFTLLALLVVLPTAVRVLSPDFVAMVQPLATLRALEGKSGDASVRSRQALEAYVVRRFGAELSDERTWRDPRTARLLAPLRPVAQRALASAGAGAASVAEHDAQAVEEGVERARTQLADGAGVGVLLAAMVALVFGVLSVLVAFLLRGGLVLRLLGVAVVTRKGAEATRIRAACRAVVGWSPVFALWIYVGAWALAGREVKQAFGDIWVAAAVVVVMICAGAWAVRWPAHGLPDRLAGTWLVPR